MSLPISLIPALSDIVAGVQKRWKVQYVDPQNDPDRERVAHLRGFDGPDVESADVRLSDWHTEWSVPLIRLAELKRDGCLRLVPPTDPRTLHVCGDHMDRVPEDTTFYRVKPSECQFCQ